MEGVGLCPSKQSVEEETGFAIDPFLLKKVLLLALNPLLSVV